MKVATVCAGVPVGVMVVGAVAMIIEDVSHPTDMFHGLGVWVGLLMLIPAITIVAAGLLVLVRINWGRVVYTAVVAVWAGLLLWLIQYDADFMVVFLLPLVCVAVSVGLVWLPGNRWFFRRANQNWTGVEPV
jgi:hypothetical protein